MNPPYVMGLDLSLTATGICVSSGQCDVAGGAAKYGDGRLVRIRNAVRHYLRGLPFTLAVIEDLPVHAKGSGYTGQVHGAVKPELLDAGVPYAKVSPATLKQFATGKGDATKGDMLAAAQTVTKYPFRDDNEVDAWWLHHMGRAALGADTAVTPTVYRRRALGVVQWPAGVVNPWKEVRGSTSSRIAKCSHHLQCLLHERRWLHAFTLTVCDKPPA